MPVDSFLDDHHIKQQVASALSVVDPLKFRV